MQTVAPSKYPAPAFHSDDAIAPFTVPPLLSGVSNDDAGAAASELTFCLFTVDIRAGKPCVYPRQGFADDAVLSAVDADFEHCDSDSASSSGSGSGSGSGSDSSSDSDSGSGSASRGRKAFVLPDPRLPMFAYVTGHTETGAKIGISLPWRPACQVEVCLENASSAAVLKARDTFMEAVANLERQLRRVDDDLAAPAAWLHVEWHVAARFNGYVPTAGAPLVRQRYWYAEVSAPNATVLKWVANSLRRGSARWCKVGPFPPYDVHEDGIDNEQAFVDAHGVQPCGWVRVPMSALVRVPDSARQLAVHYEFAMAAGSSLAGGHYHHYHHHHQRPSWHAAGVRRRPFAAVPDMSVPPSLVVACVDGEMTSGAVGRFPQASREEDAVVVTSVVLAYAGNTVPGRPAGKVFERHAFVWSAVGQRVPCAAIPGVTVHTGFATEAEALAAVRDLLFVHRCVDIVAGHNIVKFDIAYMAERAARTATKIGDGGVLHHRGQGRRRRRRLGRMVQGPGDRFLRFGALVRERLTLREKKLTSSAFGANNLRLLPGAGFAYVDTMLLCKVHPKKLRENTLAAAVEAFVPGGAKKFDMPYEDIPGIAAGQDPVAWAALAGYCVQDSELVHKLLVAWDTVRDLVAQSRTINIPLAANVLCGQQQRVRDSVMLKARASGMVMNGVNQRRWRSGGGGGGGAVLPAPTATGGFVLDSQQGFHDCPVAVLDFASLYPSVQRSRNLCWSTVVSEEVWSGLGPEDRHALGIDTYDTATGVFRFATNVEGVFPAQLGDLLAARTVAKRDMAAAKRAGDAAAAAGDEAGVAAAAAAYCNADARQKATKIVMNSGYGTANAAEDTGVMPCRALGTTTCFVGAQLNRAAMAHVQLEFRGADGTPVEVLYGDTDSIMVKFPRRGTAALPGASRLAILRDAFATAHAAEASLNAVFGKAEAKQAAARAAARAAAGLAPAASTAAGQIVNTEMEKMYYPFWPLGKKVYTGVKYDSAPGLDAPPDLAGTGTVDTKGMKMVRRDSPLFVRELTNALLTAMLRHRDNAAFWRVVHEYTYRVCLGPREAGGGPDALPLAEFAITRELKEGFEKQVPLGPQGAVAFAAEYACPGSMPQVGDRVPYVFATQPDPRRLVQPAADGKGAASPPAGLAGTGTVTVTAADAVPLRAAYARSPTEMLTHPEDNILDIVYYVEKCVATVVAQLRPDAAAKRSIAQAVSFAKQVASRAAAVRPPTKRVAALWASLSGGVLPEGWGAGAGAGAGVDADGANTQAHIVQSLRVSQPLKVLHGSEVPKASSCASGDGHAPAVVVHKKTAAEQRQDKALLAVQTQKRAASLHAFLTGGST